MLAHREPSGGLPHTHTHTYMWIHTHTDANTHTDSNSAGNTHGHCYITCTRSLASPSEFVAVQFISAERERVAESPGDLLLPLNHPN